MLARSAIGAALLLAGICQATALTALINANERNCYYADVDGAGEKVGEYHLSKGNGRALRVTARIVDTVSVPTRSCTARTAGPATMPDADSRVPRRQTAVLRTFS